MQAEPTGYPSYLDVELMSETIECIHNAIRANGIRATHCRQAKLIALLYERFLRTGKKVDLDTVQQYLTLVADEPTIDIY